MPQREQCFRLVGNKISIDDVVRKRWYYEGLGNSARRVINDTRPQAWVGKSSLAVGGARGNLVRIREIARRACVQLLRELLREVRPRPHVQEGDRRAPTPPGEL